MARVLLGNTEVDVLEDVDEILTRIVNSRDGLRLGNGAIIAPSGWVTLTAVDSDAPMYVQVARVGYVRAD